MYRVASPSQYVAITGHCIADIKIVKKACVFPWQSCTVLEVSPVNYTFSVQVMSSEKLPFILPVVFTIGPKTDEQECLLKYARLLSSHDQHVNDLVQGVIEGEILVLAASMTMEDVFNGVKKFKKDVLDPVQLELKQFGLFTYSANLKQPMDVPGREYFSCLGQKWEIEAANQRELELAEANSQLAMKKATWIKYAQVAEVEAAKAIAIHRVEEGGRDHPRPDQD